MVLGFMFMASIQMNAQTDFFFYNPEEFGARDVIGITSGFTVEPFGAGAPLGSGLLIMSLAGAGYVALKRKRSSKKGAALMFALLMLLGLTQCRKPVETIENTTTNGVRISLRVDDGELDLEMPHLMGTVYIESVPSGATVFIDDIQIGTTPVTANNIAVGEHDLLLKKDDCLPLSNHFTLNADKAFTFNGNLEHRPIGAINGVFTVGPDKKVFFSKGNLQYKPLTDTWRFAEHQWDFSLGINTQMGTEKDRWYDLFGWGTGNDPIKWIANPSVYKKFYDWGDNAISNGADVPKLWRTLTKEEWQYVKNRPKKYVQAKVNKITGWILLPDSWKDSDKVKSNISAKDWETQYEPKGAVFLPAAGKRYEKYVMQGDFEYQNSTAPSFGNACEGYPVRLVHQID